MPSTYSSNLKLELITTGEESGTWGSKTNNNLGTLLEQAIVGYVTVPITDGADTNIASTYANGVSSTARNYVLELTGVLSANRTLIVPTVQKPYIIYNNTTGGYSVTVKVSGQTGVTVANGKKAIVYTNGIDVIEVANAPVTEAGTQTLSNKTLNGFTGSTAVINVGSGQIYKDVSGNVGIGTSSPSYKLQVAGSSQSAKLYVSSSDASLSRIGLSNTNREWTISNYGTSASPNGAFVIADETAPAARFIIDTSGNVGLNGGAPSYALDVFGYGLRLANTSALLFNNASGTARAILQYFSDNNLYLDSPDGSIIYRTGGASPSERMRIDASGNVGIGTSSPAAGLQVTASTTVSSQPNVAVKIGPNVTSDLLLGSLNGNSPFVASQGAYQLLFGTNATVRMAITPNGGISFGPTTTAYGTTGQVLTSNGDAAPTWGSALVSAASQATTSGFEKDFTGIPSWAKRITVMFRGVSTNGSGNLFVQLGTASGIVGTGYISTSATQSGSNTANSTAAFLVTANIDSSATVSGIVTICLLGSNNWVASGVVKRGTSTLAYSAGECALGAQLTQVRIGNLNGSGDTFDAGSVNVMWE